MQPGLGQQKAAGDLEALSWIGGKRGRPGSPELGQPQSNSPAVLGAGRGLASSSRDVCGWWVVGCCPLSSYRQGPGRGGSWSRAASFRSCWVWAGWVMPAAEAWAPRGPWLRRLPRGGPCAWWGLESPGRESCRQIWLWGLSWATLSCCPHGRLSGPLLPHPGETGKCWGPCWLGADLSRALWGRV